MNVPKHGLGCLVAYSTCYPNNIFKKLWYLGVLLFLSTDMIVIVPIMNINEKFPYDNFKRYGIHINKVQVRYFKKSDNIKLHYLNAIHDEMCLGLDGYLQSSVNGPDIVLQLPHLPTQSLYDCYKQTLNTHNNFYIMEKMIYIKQYQKNYAFLERN